MYKTVVSYVKNLFAGCAPVARSKTAFMDARVLSQLAQDNFYIVALDGREYWYCCVRNSDIPVAKYIIRSNGLKAVSHFSAFTHGWVLRVNKKCLVRNPSGKNFVGIVMDKEAKKLGDDVYECHLQQIRQRMK